MFSSWYYVRETTGVVTGLGKALTFPITDLSRSLETINLSSEYEPLSGPCFLEHEKEEGMDRRLMAKLGTKECEQDGSLELVSSIFIELGRKWKPEAIALLVAEPGLELRDPHSGFVVSVLHKH